MRVRQTAAPHAGRSTVDLLTEVATRYQLRDDSQVRIAGYGVIDVLVTDEATAAALIEREDGR